MGTARTLEDVQDFISIWEEKKVNVTETKVVKKS